MHICMDEINDMLTMLPYISTVWYQFCHHINNALRFIGIKRKVDDHNKHCCLHGQHENEEIEHSE